MNTTLSLDVSGDQFLLPNIVRAIGQALVITPISAITTGRHCAERSGRGLGPVEYAAQSRRRGRHRDAGDLLVKREQFHSNIIGQSVTLARGEVTQRLDQVTAYFMSHGVTDRIAAMHEAIVYLGAVVRRQALIMGFSDTFAVIGVLLAVAAVALLFARKAQSAGGAPAH